MQTSLSHLRHNIKALWSPLKKHASIVNHTFKAWARTGHAVGDAQAAAATLTTDVARISKRLNVRTAMEIYIYIDSDVLATSQMSEVPALACRNWMKVIHFSKETLACQRLPHVKASRKLHRYSMRNRASPETHSPRNLAGPFARFRRIVKAAPLPDAPGGRPACSPGPILAKAPDSPDGQPACSPEKRVGASDCETTCAPTS